MCGALYVLVEKWTGVSVKHPETKMESFNDDRRQSATISDNQLQLAIISYN